MNDRSNRLALWAGLLLVGTLLAGPAVWAAQEDAKQQDASEQADKKQADEKTKTAAEPTGQADKPEPAVDSSFNTVEDVLAYRGSVRSLWAARAASEPVVQWRDADAGKTHER